MRQVHEHRHFASSTLLLLCFGLGLACLVAPVTAQAGVSEAPVAAPVAQGGPISPDPCPDKGRCPDFGAPPPGMVICASLQGRGTKVPMPAIRDAMRHPEKIRGWGELLNPGVPESLNNPRKRSLNLANPAKPYDAMWNSLAFKAGCS